MALEKACQVSNKWQLCFLGQKLRVRLGVNAVILGVNWDLNWLLNPRGKYSLSLYTGTSFDK